MTTSTPARRHACSARTPSSEACRRRRAAATHPGRAGFRRDRRIDADASDRDRSNAPRKQRRVPRSEGLRQPEPPAILRRWPYQRTDDRALGRAARGGTRRRAPRPRRLRRSPQQPLPGAAPGRARPARRRRAAASRHRRPLHPPARRLRAAFEAPDDRHHRHSLGQVAVLPAADARGPRHRPQGPRPVPLPDQGARPGPGARDSTRSD